MKFTDFWDKTKYGFDKWITYEDDKNMNGYVNKWVDSPLYSWISTKGNDIFNKEEKHPKKDSIMDFNFDKVLTCEVRREKTPGVYTTSYYPYNKVVITSKNNSNDSIIDYVYKEEGLEETTVFTHNHMKGSISIDKILNMSLNGDTVHYFETNKGSMVVM